MATTTAPAGGAQAAPLAPFRAGTQPTYKPSGYTQTNALGASQIELPDYQIGPTNLLRGIDIGICREGERLILLQDRICGE